MPRSVKIQSKSTESGFSRQKFILEGLKIITVTKCANKYEYLSMKCKYLTIYSLVIFAAEVQVTWSVFVTIIIFFPYSFSMILCEAVQQMGDMELQGKEAQYMKSF